MSPVLTNPMAACSRLQVILRVEVTVHENDRVSGCKVQAHSPCKDSLLGGAQSTKPENDTHIICTGIIYILIYSYSYNN